MATAKKEDSTSEKTVTASDRAARLVHSAESTLKAFHQEPVKSWAELSSEEADEYRAKAQKYSAPGFSFQKEHDDNYAIKRGQGWKFSAVFDRQAMTDPSLIPYNSKPEVERLKDAFISSLINI